MEKFIVHNPTNAVVSFTLKPTFKDEDFEGISKHKVRRAVRGAFLPVAIQPHHSLDLVEFSGMSVEDLKANSELHLILRKGALQVLEATIVETVPDEEEAPEEEAVEEEVKEEEAPEEEEKPEVPEMPSVPPMPSVPEDLKSPEKQVKKGKGKSKT